MAAGIRALIAAALCASGPALAAAAPSASPGPPPSDDADFDDDPAAGASHFWEGVLFAQRDRYEALVAGAVGDLRDRRRDRRAAAEATLRSAIALDPTRPLAHLWLGRALAARGDQAGCAAALDRARALDPDFRPPSGDWPLEWTLELEVALCRARAGALEAAAAVLAGLVERGVEESIVLERLGDVEMALGRLDDARATFERAQRAAPSAAGPAYGLAVALDRDEDAVGSRAALETAVARDPRLSALAATTRPYAPVEDEHYYLGLAQAHVGDRARAVHHFRRYLAGPPPPWAARARTHLAALTGVGAGDDLVARGSASIDVAQARRALSAASGALQACLRPVPSLVVGVSITRTVVARRGAPPGPSAAPPAAAPPGSSILRILGQALPGSSGPAPEPGIRATALLQDGLAMAEVRAALDCVETALGKVSLPAPKGEPGSHVTVELTLIAR